MTDPKQHANTLSILLFIYAGLQCLFALFIAIFVVFYGGFGLYVAATGGSDAAAGAAMMFIFVAIYVVMLVFGIVSIFLNIKAGMRLKKTEPASKNLLLASSIMNLLSFICGGICLAPFGIGIGIFGLWFTLSDVGKYYFQGGISTPPQPHQYGLK